MYSVSYIDIFFGTITYLKDNFCFNESIFQWQIKHISHRREFWNLIRKPAVIFPQRLFFQNSLVISWGTYWVKFWWKNALIFSTFHLWKISTTFFRFISERTLYCQEWFGRVGISQLIWIFKPMISARPIESVIKETIHKS